MQSLGRSRPGGDPRPGDEPLSVLLIDGNPEDARLFEEHLEEYATESGVEAALRHEGSLEAGLEALGEKRPSVIAVDLGLPGTESTGAVRRVAAAGPPSAPSPEGSEATTSASKTRSYHATVSPMSSTIRSGVRLFTVTVFTPVPGYGGDHENRWG